MITLKDIKNIIKADKETKWFLFIQKLKIASKQLAIDLATFNNELVKDVGDRLQNALRGDIEILQRIGISIDK